jgi:hypothetical protein
MGNIGTPERIIEILPLEEPALPADPEPVQAPAEQPEEIPA